mmetsp:Transcript_24320/g.44642  ORF Transcript_24320/g.44642 Transcript_24320/m.44642 type:complete len:305 (-) Transcript_24320:136-1050(-)
MSSKLLVLDFDGTITDAEVEGLPFRKGYIEDLAQLCGLPLEEGQKLAHDFEQEILEASPQEFGWIIGGRTVAPAVVDPYLRMKPIAHKILDHAKAFMNLEERGRLLDVILYKYNYQKTTTSFKAGARSSLEKLKGTNTFVVTNSHTAPVQGKLQTLGIEPDGSCTLEWLIERVQGDAKKYIVCDSFEDVPEKLELPGLARPVLLRRQKYYGILQYLLRLTGCSWPDMVVIGDVFELDLALPLAMGARVGLMANRYTPAYEKEFLQSMSDRAAVLTSVDQIPEFAFGCSSPAGMHSSGAACCPCA